MMAVVVIVAKSTAEDSHDDDGDCRKSQLPCAWGRGGECSLLCTAS